MVSQHLSTSALAKSPLDPSHEPVVKFEAVHSLRKMTLNRPKALNALDAEMIELIQPQLEKWEESPLANVILFKGNGKSFCAGGDVVTLVKQLDDPADWRKSSEFFQKEYSTDSYIAKMKKPIVSIMHGNTLGGGVGLSVHAPFRIATESTKIAMPETTIGLFPDVGATFFLSRLDGQLGVYLGLTSDRVTGAGALLAGFATHYVPAERLDALEARLGELSEKATHDNVNAAIEEFAADVADLKNSGYALVGAKRRAIDVIFARETAEEIVAGLKSLEEGTFSPMNKIEIKGEKTDMVDLQKWAQETRETIEGRSPTSVKVALLSIREGKTLTIDESFMLDMRIATACCNPDLHPDFKTGVTELLIIKRKKGEKVPRPAWKPSTLEEVKLASIQTLFFSSPPPFDNPPLPSIPIRHSGASYKSYPHAKYALPSEKEIQDVVTGDTASSGKYAMSAEQVIEFLVKGRNGKIGVREKVEEVLRRQCTPGLDNTIKWPDYLKR